MTGQKAHRRANNTALPLSMPHVYSRFGLSNRVRLLVFFGILVTLFSGFTPAKTASPREQLVGTWLYLWWHGTVSRIQSDNTPTDQLVFLPESYRETDQPQNETYLRFREDGTGTFFKRYVNIETQRRQTRLTVMTRTMVGTWIPQDTLAVRYEFRYWIQGGKLLIRAAGGAPRRNNSGRYDFTLDLKPERPVSQELVKRQDLGEELFIKQYGLLWKVGAKYDAALRAEYQIP